MGAGISTGARASIVGALWAELYGVEKIGGVRSVAQSFMVLSTAAAPGPLGKLLDDGVTFETIAFGGVGVVTMTSIGAAWACWLWRGNSAPRDSTEGADSSDTAVNSAADPPSESS